MLLAGIVADPGRPVGDLPLLTDDERDRTDHRLDREPRGLPCRHPRTHPDHRTGRRHPRRDCGRRRPRADPRLPGAGRAGQTGWRTPLLDRGAAPGDHIASACRAARSWSWPLWPCSRPGCAYVPLDPDYPADRLRVPARRHRRTPCADRAGGCSAAARRRHPALLPRRGDRGLAVFPAHTPQVTVRAQDAALRHLHLRLHRAAQGRGGRAPVDRAADQRRRLRDRSDGPTTWWLQAADVTFDASTFESWAPLVAGARMPWSPKERAARPACLSPRPGAARRHHAVLTTAVLDRWSRCGAGRLPGLRHLLVGGEACAPRRVAQRLAREPPRLIANIYGPTEATVLATFHESMRTGRRAAGAHRAAPAATPPSMCSTRGCGRCRSACPVSCYIGGPRRRPRLPGPARR